MKRKSKPKKSLSPSIILFVCFSSVVPSVVEGNYHYQHNTHATHDDEASSSSSSSSLFWLLFFVCARTLFYIFGQCHLGCCINSGAIPIHDTKVWQSVSVDLYWYITLHTTIAIETDCRSSQSLDQQVVLLVGTSILFLFFVDTVIYSGNYLSNAIIVGQPSTSCRSWTIWKCSIDPIR